MTSRTVFLSHQSKDKPIVRRAAEYLAENGITSILDVWSFVGGRSLHQEITDNLERADGFVLFWSALASGSKYVQFEDEIAVARQLKDEEFIVQVVLLDSTPLPKKHSFQIYHDWRRGKPGTKLFDAHLERLKRAIAGVPPEDAPSRNSGPLGRRRSYATVPAKQFLSAVARMCNCPTRQLSFKWWKWDDFGSNPRSWVPRDADLWLATVDIVRSLAGGASAFDTVFDDPYFYTEVEQRFGEALIRALRFGQYSDGKFLSAIAVSESNTRLNEAGVPTTGSVYLVFDGMEDEY